MISEREAMDHLDDAGCAPNVIRHCVVVSQTAVEIAQQLIADGKKVDLDRVKIGALLHDIGRAHTHGIDHAVEGARIATQLGLDRNLVSIIKKHIGAGISWDEAKDIGLPDDDYIPQTIEEKIVAHADNLVRGEIRVPLDQNLCRMREKNVAKPIIDKIQELADEIGVY
ncbi:MAG: TIGR00295 family protein [Euryarchaeota archaeon]|nr:TIGR00295 family protein [Euryarchaeota archaeon]